MERNINVQDAAEAEAVGSQRDVRGKHTLGGQVMRQILFRGKTKNGEWIMGDFLHPFNIAYTKIEYDRVLHGNT